MSRATEPGSFGERIRCLGCGGLVSASSGPTHRYIGASPGCWALYGELLGGGLPDRLSTLAVDAYAVQHPGVPGPQSIQSVWVHLIALHLVLDEGWPAEQAVRLRSAAADACRGWAWLPEPASRGAVTVADVVAVGRAERGRVVEAWVRGAWESWARHHAAVRERAAAIVPRR